jgi:hypothetical protein
VYELAEELRRRVEEAAARLHEIREPAAAAARIEGGWSAKQLLGHLIDSAANNHQRFVRARFTEDLVFAGYDQEQWVAAQHYDEEPWSALIELWRLYNLHLAHVLSRIPEPILTQPRHPHSLDKTAWQPVNADEPATLDYVARDYVGHLRAHLVHLLEMLET